MKFRSLKQIEKGIKNFLYKGVFPFLFKNKPAHIPIDKHKVKRLLIIRRDMIGDMVIMTSTIRYLNTLLPHAKIDVFCSPKGALVLEHHPSVSQLFVSDLKNVRESIQTAWRLRKEGYDLILAFTFARTTQDGLLANIISREAIKACTLLPSSADLYPALFNAPIDIGIKPGQSAMPLFEKAHLFCATLFGESPSVESLKQQLFISENEKKLAEKFLKDEVLQPFIVFNLSARLPEKEWGFTNAQKFLECFVKSNPHLNVVVSCDVPLREKAKVLLKSLNHEQLVLVPQIHLRAIAHIISKAKALVSPDTALVHIAATFDVHSIILCVEGHSGSEFTPLGKHTTLWANAKDGIMSISPMKVLSAVNQVISTAK